MSIGNVATTAVQAHVPGPTSRATTTHEGGALAPTSIALRGEGRTCPAKLMACGEAIGLGEESLTIEESYSIHDKIGLNPIYLTLRSRDDMHLRSVE